MASRLQSAYSLPWETLKNAQAFLWGLPLHSRNEVRQCHLGGIFAHCFGDRFDGLADLTRVRLLVLILVLISPHRSVLLLLNQSIFKEDPPTMSIKGYFSEVLVVANHTLELPDRRSDASFDASQSEAQARRCDGATPDHMGTYMDWRKQRIAF